MKTKFKYILAIFLILLLCLGLKTFANTKFKMSVDSLENISAGEKITLKIKADNLPKQGNEIVGIKFDVFYDKDNLEFVSAKKLKIASGAFDLNQDYPDEGRVRIGIISLDNIDKTGELYEVTFKVKEKITKEQVEIRLEAKEVVDGDDNEIPTEVENGTIKFKGYKESKVEENKNENIENKEEPKTESTDTNTENIEVEQNNSIVQITKQENKNMKDLIKENSIVELNTETKLSYKVENPEILEIDEEGNITTKQTGVANVEVTDENGNTKKIPISVTESKTETQVIEEENNSQDKNNIIIYVLIAILVLVLVVFLIRKYIKRKNKEIIYEKIKISNIICNYFNNKYICMPV